MLWLWKRHDHIPSDVVNAAGVEAGVEARDAVFYSFIELSEACIHLGRESNMFRFILTTWEVPFHGFRRIIGRTRVPFLKLVN